MKKIRLSPFFLLMLALICCKKEEEQPQNYDEITLNDIVKKKEMLVYSSIPVTDASGHILDNPDVVVYITEDGRYGKLQILEIDDDNNCALTLKAVTYNSDGTVLSETQSLTVRGTWYCDLDYMTESSTYEISDFHWDRVNETDTDITPLNSAAFSQYEF